MKRRIFLDMDGVLADFDGAIHTNVGEDPPEMFVPGFFRNLAVMQGAKEAVEALLADNRLEIFIGSKITSKVPGCATEKMEWVAMHFPKLLKSMCLICDKMCLRGDVLVDDDFERWAHKFEGQFIHFDSNNPRKSWEAVVKELVK